MKINSNAIVCFYPCWCAAAAASLGRRLSLGSGEVTLDCLESVDAGGEL